MAQVLDGKAISAELLEKITEETAEFVKQSNFAPGLAVVLVGADPASAVYVKNKGLACKRCGFNSFEHKLPAETSEADLLALIDQLNNDPAVHGILVQLPLPKHINEKAVIATIAQAKDVDGFTPVNVGNMVVGDDCYLPCTPHGVMVMIEKAGLDLNGKDAVVIGRSNIVGKPQSILLLEKNATVTICHSRTKDLPEVVRRADVVVAAVGRAEMVKGEWLKPGAVVIDVGINRTEDGRLVGDVDYASCEKVAGAITPVPGGVGPMTIAMLMFNTLDAARKAAARAK